MNKFLTVLKYELKEYLSNKSFLVITILLAVLGASALFLPRFIDMSGITGVVIVEHEEKVSEKDEKANTFLYLDQTQMLTEELLTAMLPDKTWKKAQSVDEVRNMVEEREAGAGFVITGLTSYDYYVYNKGMMDENQLAFDQVMKQLNRIQYCAQNGLDFAEIAAMMDVPIEVNETVLNKDTGSNFWYCYMLVIVVFMLIVLYGQMIAVAVTNEKSNRAIEVLVTSTTSNSLLFGKVIAGAIAGLGQVALILASVLISYSVNREVWGGQLDMVLDIPGEVILVFATFGMGGYLFYAFLYGAMGALVSKTEDISKSTGGLMMVIMVVYMFSLMQLTNVDGTIIKVLSFLPVSSYSTMFARIAMGTVAPWEIILSFVILVVSIFVVGILGAKLYRMGTLRYGNPISLTTALKDLKKSE